VIIVRLIDMLHDEIAAYASLMLTRGENKDTEQRMVGWYLHIKPLSTFRTAIYIDKQVLQ